MITFEEDRAKSRRFQVMLDPEDAHMLLRAASTRDMHPNKFASQLVRAVLRDNLIDAVIDDAQHPVPFKPRVAASPI